MRALNTVWSTLLGLLVAVTGYAQQPLPVVPSSQRGNRGYEREGTIQANNIRTAFFNYGMVGKYPSTGGGGVDVSTYHSVEVPKGSGTNYTDGVTPFILCRTPKGDIMITGYRERQALEPFGRWDMKLEPRPGYFQTDVLINRDKSPAIWSDRRTWPDKWPDKMSDTTDPGWAGSWNGYFGKRQNADEELFYVVDDNAYSAWQFYPDYRDSTRRGLGVSMNVHGFQWANPQAGNVVFFQYDVLNESTTNYDDNIIFGIYFDSGVGGEGIGCEGFYESDDDNASYTNFFGGVKINLTYTWDNYGDGISTTSICARTGYLGYAYLETPGNPFDNIDNDFDGIIDERRDSGPGTLIQGGTSIRNYILSHPSPTIGTDGKPVAGYNLAAFENFYGKLEERPAFKAGYWWTGDENMNWVAEFDDVGVDGIPGTHDLGEGDGIPTPGEPDFDQTDVDESDQIGLTGFKMNRIAPGYGSPPNAPVDGIEFYNNSNNNVNKHWVTTLYNMFTDPVESNRYDNPTVMNYNIAFLFASGTFKLPVADRERFSLALAFGGDLTDLQTTVRIVQRIYAASYQFTVPPKLPILTAQAGNKYVRLTWSDISERHANPITHKFDFEGYKIYRATDAEFVDAMTITNARGTGLMSFGKPLAQFDIVNDYAGYSDITVDGVAYYLGNNSGITHTFVDTTVLNGVNYYYAVCAYSHGDSTLGYYPAENPIQIRTTLRGGTVLPQNAVQVRPNPKAAGYTDAATGQVTRVGGGGTGTVRLKVLNSNDVPDGTHTFQIRMKTNAPENIRADYYQLVDSVSNEVYMEHGSDFDATGKGSVAAGILPLITTLGHSQVDTALSGFNPSSKSNAKLEFVLWTDTINTNRYKIGYPNDIEIDFFGTVVDTSAVLPYSLFRASPLKFKTYAITPEGKMPLKCYFLDLGATRDSTLSTTSDLYYITARDTILGRDTLIEVWRVKLVDTTSVVGSLVPPQPGDVYRMHLNVPFGGTDVFSFTTTGQRVDEAAARQTGAFDPYVVPNPYAGWSKFEPAPYATSGRGIRRLEFRGLPAVCTIRIYTVRGELVQTLYNNGRAPDPNDSDIFTGFVPWDLRSKDNLDVAPGLYLFHVDAGPLGTKTGKFAIIK